MPLRHNNVTPTSERHFDVKWCQNDIILTSVPRMAVRRIEVNATLFRRHMPTLKHLYLLVGKSTHNVSLQLCQSPSYERAFLLAVQ